MVSRIALITMTTMTTFSTMASTTTTRTIIDAGSEIGTINLGGVIILAFLDQSIG